MNLATRLAGASALMLISVARAADYFDETTTTTLFAFDNVSIPHSQNLRLEMRSPTRHLANPVLQRGAPGTPDAMGVQFYGSILREGGKFRMWYVAFDDDTKNKVASARWRAAYAESDDGVKWTKPNLGLVEHGGNRNNNLILTAPAPLGFVNLKVLADPEDPNPERRYKISTHVYFRHNTRLGTLAPFASTDGLRWKLLVDAAPRKAELLEKDLVLPAVHFEPCGGLYKWDGMYFICGQNAMNATQPYNGRVVRMYRSADFVNWSQTSSIAFVRTPQHTLLGPGRSREGEQNHEGISVWNRRNILLGITGQWHGAKEWKDVTVDLGFVVSNDGVSFREPAHEWTFLKRGEDGAWDPRGTGGPAQSRGGVGIAALPRDRFGDLVVETIGKGPGDYQLPEITSEFVTAAVPVKPGTTSRFFLNADGLGPEAALKVELLDDKERPLPDWSGKDAAFVRQSGFQTPILWSGKSDVTGIPERIRLHVTFEGKRNTDIRFSALYVKSAD